MEAFLAVWSVLAVFLSGDLYVGFINFEVDSLRTRVEPCRDEVEPCRMSEGSELSETELCRLTDGDVPK